MALQTTFGANEVLRRLGVKGGQTMTIQSAAAQPVIIMGDFSNTLSVEPFEGRSVVGGFAMSPASGDRVTMELKAIGGGGIVIEHMWMRGDPTAGGNRVRLSSTSLGLASAMDKVEFGGVPTLSVGAVGLAPDITASSVLLPGESGGQRNEFFNLRWFVRPGVFIQVQQRVNTNANYHFAVSFRELPEQVGGA